MPDKGNFIAGDGNKQNVGGILIKKTNIHFGGLHLVKIKIRPEEFYLIFSCSSTIKIVGNGQETLLLANHYLILSEPHDIDYQILIENKNQGEDILFIRLERLNFNEFTQTISLNNPMIMEPEVRNILNNVINCTYQNQLKSNYIQAKITELLCTMENQIINFHHTKKNIGIPVHMIEPINLAREILIENLKDPLSLASLARKIGTNENYLKKYFKVVYGQTVFGFLNDYKMQLAKSMLVKEKMPINQIAADLGYKNSSNFSANFFKYYGFLPKKLKCGCLYMFVFVRNLMMLLEDYVMMT